jgi:hypothetical protein
MRQLKWNEYEVVECLGVLSIFDEDSGFYDFKVEIGDLVVELGICSYNSFVEIRLFQSTNAIPIFETSFYVFKEIRFINERNISYSEYSDCVIARLYDFDHNDGSEPIEFVTFQLHMLPNLQLRIF